MDNLAETNERAQDKDLMQRQLDAFEATHKVEERLLEVDESKLSQDELHNLAAEYLARKIEAATINVQGDEDYPKNPVMRDDRKKLGYLLGIMNDCLKGDYSKLKGYCAEEAEMTLKKYGENPELAVSDSPNPHGRKMENERISVALKFRSVGNLMEPEGKPYALPYPAWNPKQNIAGGGAR